MNKTQQGILFFFSAAVFILVVIAIWLRPIDAWGKICLTAAAVALLGLCWSYAARGEA